MFAASGALSRARHSAQLPEPQSLRRPDPVAELHPLVAARHGIQNAEWVWVVSPRGRIRMKAMVTADIREDVVNVDHGWWFPERDAPEFGVWDSNANLLTANTPPYDPAFGSYQLRALLCRLEQAQDGDADDAG